MELKYFHCWDWFRFAFKFLCIIGTIVLCGGWLHRYFLDEDKTVVETATYLDTKDDFFPMFSLCFEQSFKDEDLKRLGFNFSGKDYHDYLRGKNSSNHQNEMESVDFDAVSISNISNFVISYRVWYKNRTSLLYTLQHNLSWRLENTITVNLWYAIAKCFTIEITDSEVTALFITFKKDVFPNNNRYLSALTALLHYPNQVLYALDSQLNNFKASKMHFGAKDVNYLFSVRIKDFEIELHRYKSRQENCVPQSKNYDQHILENYLKSVGCKAPYHFKSIDLPICQEKSDMFNSGDLLFKRQPPCAEISKIDYEVKYEKAIGKRPLIPRKEWKKVGKEKAWSKYFEAAMIIFNFRFKKIVRKKDIDFQSMVGYIGGYIGMITGFALFQLPYLLRIIYLFIRKFNVKRVKAKFGKIVPIQRTEEQEKQDSNTVILIKNEEEFDIVVQIENQEKYE